MLLLNRIDSALTLLYSAPADAYTFQPVDAASAAASKPEILVIDRADGDIRLEQSLPNGATSGKVMDVQGK